MWLLPVNCCPAACREFPGEVEKIRVWFRDYKTPDGKPQNKFGYNDQVTTASWCSLALHYPLVIC